MTERLAWEDSISRLLQKALSHTTTYTVPNISNFKVSVHPNVYSPKYFPESKWYGQQLENLVKPGQVFLEVGVGSGIVAMHVARAGGKVKGVDINPDAVEIAKRNFWQNRLDSRGGGVKAMAEARTDNSYSSASYSPSQSLWELNAAATGTARTDSGSDTEKDQNRDLEEPLQEADIRVSDLYSALPRGSKFHYIFWNHPWQNSTSIVKELQTEKTLDEGYRSLSRYMAQGREYLYEGGEILIGTSCYADLGALNVLAEENGFRTEVAREGKSLLEDGTTEEVYYILRLVDLQKTQA
ncbi:S-adenosyl-L-methionine-dependent methyltransferase [Linnemannia elongata]|nr:S-adenosyl-L-methionine-dependent methyltransferase [Linnemannia elongata]